jgi:nucleoside triphosphate pyrophosphatase
MNLILASQSPRRKELLAILGHEFSVVPSIVDEMPNPGEQPEQYVGRVSRDKGLEVASRVSAAIILSADTIVVVDDEILGKPVDKDDAFRMLRKLSGREHSVYTAVTLINQPKKEMLEGLERTRV